jgi:zinc transporter ZupT
VLCVHSLLDGVAIGLAFQASKEVGIIVAIAVLTHDFSDGINTMNIVLKNQGQRPRALPGCCSMRWRRCWHRRHGFLQVPMRWFGTVLALFAGFFLYIGASDLIPESYHAHPKFLTTVMTLAGAAVLYRGESRLIPAVT